MRMERGEKAEDGEWISRLRLAWRSAGQLLAIEGKDLESLERDTRPRHRLAAHGVLYDSCMPCTSRHHNEGPGVRGGSRC